MPFVLPWASGQRFSREIEVNIHIPEPAESPENCDISPFGHGGCPVANSWLFLGLAMAALVFTFD